MSRICELTGKGRQVGNNVSHAIYAAASDDVADAIADAVSR